MSPFLKFNLHLSLFISSPLVEKALSAGTDVAGRDK